MATSRAHAIRMTFEVLDESGQVLDAKWGIYDVVDFKKHPSEQVSASFATIARNTVDYIQKVMR